MKKSLKAALACATIFIGAFSAQASENYQIVPFDALHSWSQDDHALALRAFTNTCGDLDEEAWLAPCQLAKTGPDPKVFFEVLFSPVRIKTKSNALITGYYEPEIDASRVKRGRFIHPVFARPGDLKNGVKYHTRREILEDEVLAGRGYEIAYVADPVALFYMQIQGSGRLRMPNGQIVRLGYAATNGHETRSLGKELVDRGIYNEHQVSARVVSNWVKRNPVEGRELLLDSPNYVFFREISELDENAGPRGAMNRSLTAGRSLAVDPAFIPLGAPVWMEKGGAEMIRRLMVAQDTGSAIKGAQRADLFVGSGQEAGDVAARINDPVRLIVLLPNALAHDLVENQ